MKNEENFVENLVVPATKLFGAEIDRHRNCLVPKVAAQKLQRRKVVDARCKTTYFFKTKTSQAMTKTTFSDQERFF